jgi:hypothetical protein
LVAAFFMPRAHAETTPLGTEKMSFRSTITTDDQPVVTAQTGPRVSPLVEQKSGDGITRVKDANGRSIGVKPLKAIDMFRLTKALGEDASNAALFRQAMVAVAAVEIDGEHVVRPTNMMLIEALISRLDFAGFVAVSTALAGAAEATNIEAVKI